MPPVLTEKMEKWHSGHWAVTIPKEALQEIEQESKNYSSWREFSIEKVKPHPALTQFVEQVKKLLAEDYLAIALVKGLDLTVLSEDQARIGFLLISHLLGKPIASQLGETLYNIQAEDGVTTVNRTALYSKTTEQSGFHTDATSYLNLMPDVVGLLCIRKAKEGGVNRISNAHYLHDVLERDHPDTLKVLYEDYIRENAWAYTGGEKEPTLEERKANKYPIFSKGRWYPGLSFRYMRYLIERGHQLAESPLSQSQVNALNVLDQVLNDPKNFSTLTLEPGEILFTQNHLLPHDRTAFVDYPDKQLRRLLIRIWIDAPFLH